jgi:FkbM family methyltransferase
MTADATTPADAADPASYRAQHGEDRILFEYFGRKRSGYYVEVGAFNGVDLSNTYFFEQVGWDGILVEPHPELAARCRRDRPRAAVFACAVVPPGAPASVAIEVSDGAELYSSIKMGHEQHRHVRRETGGLSIRRVEVEARTLDAVLEEAGAPEGIDFVTIDVEGHEQGVLEGFDLTRWRPRVVILERNGAILPPGIARHMTRHGYAYGLRTGVNDWYFAPGADARPAAGYVTRLVLRHYVLAPAAAAAKAVLRPVARPIKAALRRARPAPAHGEAAAADVAALARRLPNAGSPTNLGGG